MDGVTLTLTYSEVLDNGVTLGTTPFAVRRERVTPVTLRRRGWRIQRAVASVLGGGGRGHGDGGLHRAPTAPISSGTPLGRKAASFSGQAVTNDTASAREDTAKARRTRQRAWRTTAAYSLNTPATRVAQHHGTAQVEETLTAGTTGIADNDGLNNANFAYQWLADGARSTGQPTAATPLLHRRRGQGHQGEGVLRRRRRQRGRR